MNEKKVLIIDPEPDVRLSLADRLGENGYSTLTAPDGAQGLAAARAEQTLIVLADLHAPKVDGLEIISTLKAEQPELPVVIVCGTGKLEDAITALREGAWDYITKPIQDFGAAVNIVERTLRESRLRAERNRYHEELITVNDSLEAEVTRQNQELQAHERELAALNRVSYAISDLLDPDTMLHRAIGAAMAVIDADGGIVRLLNPATEQLVIAVTRGLSESYQNSTQAVPLGQGIVGRVAQSGHPHIGRDWAEDAWLASLGTVEGFRCYLCVPLRTGKRIVGTLEMATMSDRDFRSREIELVTTIGNQIGLAVARAQNAAELERANANLRRLDTLREQFIQNVSHELRMPLALVHGYVEMLAQGDLEPDEQQMALSVASRRIKALVALVESITTLQDLDSEPLRMETVNRTELVQTAMRMAAQRATTAQVNLVDAGPQDLQAFQGDFTRLTQALHQLIDNACKFSSEGSTVTISTDMKPNAVRISVADKGIGIPPEQLEFIFERFYQADGSTRRRYGGTGLGLAIAKEICEAHGGDLTVRSKEGQGSVFIMEIPRQSKEMPVHSTPNSA